MKIRFQSLIPLSVRGSFLVAGLWLGLASPVRAQIRVLEIRGHDAATSAFIAANPGLVPTPSSVTVFDSGITLVRLEENLTQRDVVVLLPEAMDSHHFMEALLKVRSAMQTGALRVTVVAPAGLAQTRVTRVRDGQPIELDVESLFRIAGADLIRDPRGTREPKGLQPRGAGKGRAISGERTYLSGPADWSLVEGLQKATGLPMLAPDTALKGAKVLSVLPMTGPTDDSLLTLVSESQRLRRAGVAYHEVMTGYLPYARLDRPEKQGRTIAGGSLAADLIEGSGVDATSFVRPHAHQSVGFFKGRVTSYTGRPAINAYLHQQGVQVVVAPDAGAQKDDTEYADELGVDKIAIINKQRFFDKVSGKTKTRIRGISGSEVRGKIVVIIDDETESGGTLAKAAEFLKQRGAAKVLVVVTHLAGPAKAALDSRYIDEIVVTDTFPIKNPHAKIHVISVADEIAADWKQTSRLSNALSFRCLATRIKSLALF